MTCTAVLCSKIAEAEAAVSANKKKWLVMHVRMRLDELVCIWTAVLVCICF